MLVGGGFGCLFVYDLTLLRGPLGEVEDLAEFGLRGGGLGEYAAGFGAATGGRIDQDGFLDLAELFEQLADGEVQAGVVGLTAYEVGDLQGEDAGKGVHADVVLGEVVHG